MVGVLEFSYLLLFFYVVILANQRYLSLRPFFDILLQAGSKNTVVSDDVESLDIEVPIALHQSSF